ncbi:protein O-GlcNAc transferase [Burkholderia multivorans]
MTPTSVPSELAAEPGDLQQEHDLQFVLQGAIEAHRQEALDDAEALYRVVLSVAPQHGTANYNLGLIAMQRGRHDDALPLLETALGANPNEGQYWASYIDALRRAGQMNAAWLMLEMAQQRGLKGPAIDTLVYLMSAHGAETPATPTSPPAGAREAVAPAPSDGRASAKAPRKAHRMSGKAPSPQQMQQMVALFNRGRVPEAIAIAEAMAQRFPHHPMGWRVLGIARHALGQFDVALEPLQKALDLVPDDVQAGTLLADILRMKGAIDDSVALCERLLKRYPDDAECHRTLGMCRQAQGRLDEAEASCQRAMALRPDISEMPNTLGVVHLDQGRTLDAEACFRRAIEIQPDNAFAHHNLLFCLSHRRDIDAATLFEHHRRFAALCETPLQPSWRAHSNDRDPERRLRIGFVSADLFNHAVSTFVEPILAHLAHDDNFSLYIYYNFTREDSITQKIRSYATEWHAVWSMTDRALAEKIRADGIDILIDLSGHTARNRLITFAHKPAPVQVSWIGYPGTTGLTTMDYYLADPYLVPRGAIEAQFTEKVVHLPAVAPFRPPEVAPPVNVLPALRNGYITFGSFNRLNKLHPDVIALWAKLLKAVPNARMLIGGLPEDGSDGGLGEWFDAEGIGRERIEYRARAALSAYMQQHHHVDICLDTFPYSGATTTLHSMWMGIPTISLPSDTVASRGGISLQSHVGLDEFIAHDRDEYVRIGVHWANNPLALADLRANLRQRCSASALFRPEIIVDGLSIALRTMWRRWCNGQAPQAFDVRLPDGPQSIDAAGA